MEMELTKAVLQADSPLSCHTFIARPWFRTEICSILQNAWDRLEATKCNFNTLPEAYQADGAWGLTLAEYCFIAAN
jgi:hypothetical protein